MGRLASRINTFLAHLHADAPQAPAVSVSAPSAPNVHCGYSVAAVANVLLRLARAAGAKLTQPDLHRFAFISHGFMWAGMNRPLYYNHTEARRFGPHIPDLLDDLRRYGTGVVRKPIATHDEVPEGSPAYQTIANVYSALGKMSETETIGLTHLSRTPWAIARKRGLFIIPNQIIREQFVSFLADNEKPSQIAETPAPQLGDAGAAAGAGA